jgi:hypothetical protein
MKSLFKIICSFLLVTATFAQQEKQDKEIKFNPKAKFFEDYLNFASTEEGKTRLDVFIQVPYSEIQFVKTTGGFESKYNLTVSVFDEDRDNLLVEK